MNEDKYEKILNKSSKLAISHSLQGRNWDAASFIDFHDECVSFVIRRHSHQFICSSRVNALQHETNVDVNVGVAFPNRMNAIDCRRFHLKFYFGPFEPESGMGTSF